MNAPAITCPVCSGTGIVYAYNGETEKKPKRCGGCRGAGQLKVGG